MKAGDFEPIFIGAEGAEEGVSPKNAGSKAYMLWRMGLLRLAIPPAFVMPTQLCAPVNAGLPQALQAVDDGLHKGIAYLEKITGRRFGDMRAPLLVSVRSGAERSMPGMLQTILNVGLTHETVHGLIRMTGNPRLAFDSHRRFVQSFAEAQDDATAQAFGQSLAAMMHAEEAQTEADLDCEALERLAKDYLDLAARALCRPIPQDPMEQLASATRAVYRSWESARAREYRRLNRLDALQGTAVTVQAMVFGNAGANSGAGVAFSRNPATGANELYVDYLPDAQGEDVVSGRRTPGDAGLLKSRLPALAGELAAAARRLETEFGDAQDIEFTVEEGKLYFLQTRAAKRTPLAAVRIAAALVREGLIDPKIALARLEGIDLDRAGERRFAGTATPVARATPASPGVASGRAVFESARAKAIAQEGGPVILIRPEISTADIAGFAAAAGILTAAGGRTAHAAVVARQMGLTCLVGCNSLAVDANRRQARLADATVSEGDWISLDGGSGEIFLGEREIITQRPEAELGEIAKWRASSPQG